MKTIRTLTDKEILGKDGLSSRAPRMTARAIIKNRDGLYAVIYAKKYELYSLPGGGVENGEDIVSALRREVLEETGCICDEIREIGIVFENRACFDYTQKNHYFAVTSLSEPKTPMLTEKEALVGTQVQWHTFEEVYRLISDNYFANARERDIWQRSFIKARDLAALDEYKKNGWV